MCACLVVCYRHLFGCVLHAQSLWCTVCACESGANAPVFNLLLHVAWCCPLALTTAALQYGPEATGFVRWVAAASPWCAAQPSVSRSTCHRTWSKYPQSSSLTQPGLGRSRLRCSNYRLTPGWGVVSNKVAYSTTQWSHAARVLRSLSWRQWMNVIKIRTAPIRISLRATASTVASQRQSLLRATIRPRRLQSVARRW